MSAPLVFPSKPPDSGVDIGVSIPQSVMLNRASASYMVMTGAGDADSNTIGTVSFWVKRSASLGSQQAVWSSYVASSDTNFVEVGFNSSGQFYVSNWGTFYLVTTQVFRDTSAWYHFVVRFDTTDGTANDRIRVWVNGTEVTSFGTRNNPGASATLGISSAASTGIRVGQSTATGSTDVDGYLADFYYIDGTAYDASDFGEFNVQGHWIPKVFAGSYGTYGYRLTFADNTHYGDDTSGNGNDLTDSGLGTDHQKVDTPTNNHCTFNPLGSSTTHLFAEGNMVAANISAGGSWSRASSTFFMESGKWYWEVNLDSATAGEATFGVASAIASTSYLGIDGEGWGLENPSGTVLVYRHDNTQSSNFTDTGTLDTGKYVMVAYDADNGKLWFGIDGTWLESGDPAGDANEIVVVDRLVCPAISSYSTSEDLRLRTEEGDFEGTMPAGFKALNSVNLPEPTIPKGSDYFDSIIWTGDGSNPRDIGGYDFAPDLVWLKPRNLGLGHLSKDLTRGLSDGHLIPDSITQAVGTPTTGQISAFNADGFEVDAGSSNDNSVNDSGDEYVAWCWKEALIAGLDIAIYTGTGSAHTEAHDLSAVPDVMIVKRRDGDVAWANYHGNRLDSSSVPVSDPETDYLVLDTTAAPADLDTVWNDAAPDADNFSVGTSGATNTSTGEYVAYLWREVLGFSKFGAYVGNGNADGTFVWCGFRPKLIIAKRTDTVGNWVMLDQERADVPNANPNDNYIYADVDDAEASGAYATDFLSNGFKCRATNAAMNAASGEFTFMAFAEHPFKYARAV